MNVTILPWFIPLWFALSYFPLTKFQCYSFFSDLPTTSTTVLVPTTATPHSTGTTTITAVLGSASNATNAIPKTVSEATITTPSFHLPSTTSILIDSEMTTGNSNLSQHCKRTRFPFSSISWSLSHWWETCQSNRDGSDAGPSCWQWALPGALSAGVCAVVADVTQVTQDVKGLVPNTSSSWLQCCSWIILQACHLFQLFNDSCEWKMTPVQLEPCWTFAITSISLCGCAPCVAVATTQDCLHYIAEQYPSRDPYQALLQFSPHKKEWNTNILSQCQQAIPLGSAAKVIQKSWAAFAK